MGGCGNVRVAGLGFAFKGLYTAMLSGGVPGFLLRIRGNKKKASGDFSFFLAFAFLSRFCISDYISYLIRSKKGGSNELGKMRRNFDTIYSYPFGRSPNRRRR